MRRHRRQNLLLAAAVGVLGAIAWFVTAQEQGALAPLTTIDTTRVATLRVSAGDRPSRSFERRDGRWWMREPYAMPAHADAVTRLLAIASSPTRSRHPLDGFDAARIGLAPPQALLELGGTQLEFGITDAIHGDRYVRTANAIALMPDRFSGWLLAPAESEIDHRLAEPLQQVTQVRIDGVDQPGLTDAWDRVTTSQVIAADANAASAATIAVELVDASQNHVSYRVQRREDGRYVAVRTAPPLAYPLDENQMQQLLPAVP